jgi:hypothetical protein
MHTALGRGEVRTKRLYTQSAGPVRLLIFCSISIFLLASLVQVGNPILMLARRSRECTPPYLSTGKSNLLQPAQAEVVLGQLSMYLASCVTTLVVKILWRGSIINMKYFTNLKQNLTSLQGMINNPGIKKSHETVSLSMDVKSLDGILLPQTNFFLVSQSLVFYFGLR